MRVLRLCVLVFAVSIVVGLVVPIRAGVAGQPDAVAQEASGASAAKDAPGQADELRGNGGVPEDGGQAAGEPEDATDAGLSHEQATKIAGLLVAKRDRALMDGDRQQLESLTVEGGSAREYDAGVFEAIGGRVESIETKVDAVSVRGPRTVEVRTTQRSLELSDGSRFGQAQPRCTRWELEPSPWRIASTAACQSR